LREKRFRDPGQARDEKRIHIGGAFARLTRLAFFITLLVGP
jgi:hypothetical protein